MKKITYIIIGLGSPREEKEEKKFINALNSDNKKYNKSKRKLPFLPFLSDNKKNINLAFSKYKERFSPYEEIENIKKKFSRFSFSPVLTFHYYLQSTHDFFFSSIRDSSAQSFYIFPLFPQFSYFFAGKIADFFAKNLPNFFLNKFYWIKSFPTYSKYVVSYQKTIKETLKEKHLREEETILIFSACSIPSQVVDDGDLYLFESNLSFKAILKAFPFALGALSFQGGFYFQDSLSPSTLSICENIESLSKKRKNVLIVPFSLVYNDWLTFYEIESIYLPLLRKKGYKSFLCPTISSHPVWKDSICNIFDDCNFVNNEMLTKYHEKK